MAEQSGSDEEGEDWRLDFGFWIGNISLGVLFVLLYRCFRVFFGLLLKFYRRTLAWLNPKYGRRLALLQWIEKRAGRKIHGFSELWENPELLSVVVDSVIPQAYEEGEGEDVTRHAALQQIQSTLSRYFEIRPMFLGEELKRSWDRKIENKFIRLLHLIKASIERLERTTKQEDASEYVARGMGLITATQGHAAFFYVYSRHELDFDAMRITIAGPNGDAGEITVIGSREDSKNHTTGIHIKYEVIANAGSLQDGVKKCLKVVYTPNQTGSYRLDISKHGYIILGSPFNITVDPPSRKIPTSSATPKSETRVINRIVDFVNEKMLLTDKGELIKISSDSQSSSALTTLKTRMNEQSSVALSLAKILQKDAAREAKPTPEVFFEICEYIMKTCHFILQNSSSSRGLRLISGANKCISRDSLLLDDGIITEVAHTEQEMKKLLEARAALENNSIQNESVKDPDVAFIDNLLAADNRVSCQRIERRRKFERHRHYDDDTSQAESLDDDVFSFDGNRNSFLKRPASTENYLNPDVIMNRSQLVTPDIVYVNLLETEDPVICRQIDPTVKSAPVSLSGVLSSEHSITKAREFFKHNKEIKNKVTDLESNFFKSVEESLVSDESNSLSEADGLSVSEPSTADLSFFEQREAADILKNTEAFRGKPSKIIISRQENIFKQMDDQSRLNTCSRVKEIKNEEKETDVVQEAAEECAENEIVESTKVNVSVRKIINDFEKMLQAQNEQVDDILNTMLDHPSDKTLVPHRSDCVNEEDYPTGIQDYEKVGLHAPTTLIQNQETTTESLNGASSSTSYYMSEAFGARNSAEIMNSLKLEESETLKQNTPQLCTEKHKKIEIFHKSVFKQHIEENISDDDRVDDPSHRLKLDDNDDQVRSTTDEVVDGVVKDQGNVDSCHQGGTTPLNPNNGPELIADDKGDTLQNDLLNAIVAPFERLEQEASEQAVGTVREELLQIGKTLVEALLRHPIQTDTVKNVIKRVSLQKSLSAESVKIFLSSLDESNHQILSRQNDEISESIPRIVNSEVEGGAGQCEISEIDSEEKLGPMIDQFDSKFSSSSEFRKKSLGVENLTSLSMETSFDPDDSWREAFNEVERPLNDDQMKNHPVDTYHKQFKSKEEPCSGMVVCDTKSEDKSISSKFSVNEKTEEQQDLETTSVSSANNLTSEDQDSTRKASEKTVNLPISSVQKLQPQQDQAEEVACNINLMSLTLDGLLVSTEESRVTNEMEVLCLDESVPDDRENSSCPEHIPSLCDQTIPNEKLHEDIADIQLLRSKASLGDTEKQAESTLNINANSEIECTSVTQSLASCHNDSLLKQVKTEVNPSIIEATVRMPDRCLIDGTSKFVQKDEDTASKNHGLDENCINEQKNESNAVAFLTEPITSCDRLKEETVSLSTPFGEEELDSPSSMSKIEPNKVTECPLPAEENISREIFTSNMFNEDKRDCNLRESDSMITPMSVEIITKNLDDMAIISSRRSGTATEVIHNSIALAGTFEEENRDQLLHSCPPILLDPENCDSSSISSVDDCRELGSESINDSKNNFDETEIQQKSYQDDPIVAVTQSKELEGSDSDIGTSHIPAVTQKRSVDLSNDFRPPFSNFPFYCDESDEFGKIKCKLCSDQCNVDRKITASLPMSPASVSKIRCKLCSQQTVVECSSGDQNVQSDSKSVSSPMSTTLDEKSMDQNDLIITSTTSPVRDNIIPLHHESELCSEEAQAKENLHNELINIQDDDHERLKGNTNQSEISQKEVSKPVTKCNTYEREGLDLTSGKTEASGAHQHSDKNVRYAKKDESFNEEFILSTVQNTGWEEDNSSSQNEIVLSEPDGTLTTDISCHISEEGGLSLSERIQVSDGSNEDLAASVGGANEEEGPLQFSSRQNTVVSVTKEEMKPINTAEDSMSNENLSTNESGLDEIDPALDISPCTSVKPAEKLSNVEDKAFASDECIVNEPICDLKSSQIFQTESTLLPKEESNITPTSMSSCNDSAITTEMMCHTVEHCLESECSSPMSATNFQDITEEYNSQDIHHQKNNDSGAKHETKININVSDASPNKNFGICASVLDRDSLLNAALNTQTESEEKLSEIRHSTSVPEEQVTTQRSDDIQPSRNDTSSDKDTSIFAQKDALSELHDIDAQDEIRSIDGRENSTKLVQESNEKPHIINENVTSADVSIDETFLLQNTVNEATCKNQEDQNVEKKVSASDSDRDEKPLGNTLLDIESNVQADLSETKLDTEKVTPLPVEPTTSQHLCDFSSLSKVDSTKHSHSLEERRVFSSDDFVIVRSKNSKCSPSSEEPRIFSSDDFVIISSKSAKHAKSMVVSETKNSELSASQAVTSGEKDTSDDRDLNVVSSGDSSDTNIESHINILVHPNTTPTHKSAGIDDKNNINTDIIDIKDTKMDEKQAENVNRENEGKESLNVSSLSVMGISTMEDHFSTKEFSKDATDQEVKDTQSTVHPPNPDKFVLPSIQKVEAISNSTEEINSGGARNCGQLDFKLDDIELNSTDGISVENKYKNQDNVLNLNFSEDHKNIDELALKQSEIHSDVSEIEFKNVPNTEDSDAEIGSHVTNTVSDRTVMSESSRNSNVLEIDDSTHNERNNSIFSKDKSFMVEHQLMFDCVNESTEEIRLADHLTDVNGINVLQEVTNTLINLDGDSQTEVAAKSEAAGIATQETDIMRSESSSQLALHALNETFRKEVTDDDKNNEKEGTNLGPSENEMDSNDALIKNMIFSIVCEEDSPGDDHNSTNIDPISLTKNIGSSSLNSTDSNWFSSGGGEGFAEYHSDSIINDNWLDVKTDKLISWSPYGQASPETCSDSIQVSKELDFESIISAPNLDMALRKLEQKINNAQKSGMVVKSESKEIDTTRESLSTKCEIDSYSLPNFEAFPVDDSEEFRTSGSNEPLFDWKTISSMGVAEREIWGLPLVIPHEFASDNVNLSIPQPCTRVSRPSSPIMDTITEVQEEQEEETSSLPVIQSQTYCAEVLPVITLTPEHSVDEFVIEAVMDENKLLPLDDSKFREDLKILSVLDYMNVGVEKVPTCYTENFKAEQNNDVQNFIPHELSGENPPPPLETTKTQEIEIILNDEKEAINTCKSLLKTSSFLDCDRFDNATDKHTVSTKVLMDQDSSTVQPFECKLPSNETSDDTYNASSEDLSVKCSINLDSRVTISPEYEDPNEVGKYKSEEKSYRIKTDECFLEPALHSDNEDKISVTLKCAFDADTSATKLEEIPDNHSHIGSDFNEIKCKFEKSETFSRPQSPRMALLEEIQSIGKRVVEDKIKQFDKCESRYKESENPSNDSGTDGVCGKLEPTTLQGQFFSESQKTVSVPTQEKTTTIKEKKEKMNGHIAAQNKETENNRSNLVSFWKMYWDKIVEENQHNECSQPSQIGTKHSAKGIKTTPVLLARECELLGSVEDTIEEEKNYSCADTEDASEINMKKLNIIDRIRLFENFVNTMNLEENNRSAHERDILNATFPQGDGEETENFTSESKEINIQDDENTKCHTGEYKDTKRFELERNKSFQNRFIKAREFFELLEKHSSSRGAISIPNETQRTLFERSLPCGLEKKNRMEFRKKKRKRKSSRRQLEKGFIQSAPTSDSETPPHYSYQMWGSERLGQKVVERIHIKDLFEDVYNETDRTGLFRGGVPNKKAVLASLRSIDLLPEGVIEMTQNDEDDIMNRDLFFLSEPDKISKVPRGYQNVYPWIPTTPIHQYRSRPCAEHNLIPRNALLQILNED
ncbi:unnamed protein product [Bemisia tabaci]|uniref:Uncharacterized protein n=1 Tax=Bemisia tabaci TaxID=7038 RepID=A0A9P0ALM4_BEMTA|nr:unnamed protein product [Bemisia tabaci]